MVLCSPNHEKLDTSKFTYYNEGTRAKIYRCDDVLLKVYKNDCKYRYYLSKGMFRLLKGINVPNIVRLHEYYHYEDDKFIFLPMAAYSMELIYDQICFTKCDRKFLIEILSMLEETIKKLSEHKLILGDCHGGNIIFNKNGVTIIDPDQFWRFNLSTKIHAYILNKCAIIRYLDSTVSLELRDLYKNLGITHQPFFEEKNGVSSLTHDVLDKISEDTIYDCVLKKVMK